MHYGAEVMETRIKMKKNTVKLRHKMLGYRCSVVEFQVPYVHGGLAPQLNLIKKQGLDLTPTVLQDQTRIQA